MKLFEKDILNELSHLNRDLPSKSSPTSPNTTTKSGTENNTKSNTLNKNIPPKKNDTPKKKGAFSIVNNTKSGLNLFVETRGFESSDFTGKSFSIVKKSNSKEEHVFFQNLWNKINKNNDNFSLIKNTSTNDETTWTKSYFQIKSENKISFNVKEKITSSNAIKSINKLHGILFSIESKSGKKAAKKYLDGFLEEKCMSYSEYIQHLTT